MRKYLFLLLLVSNLYTAFCQSGDSIKLNSSKEDLLTLSKTQRTRGIILGCGGVVLMTIAAGLTVAELNNLFEPEDSDHGTTIIVLNVTGILAIAGGIYLLIKSRKTYSKAISLGFIVQPIESTALLPNGNFPAAQLRIRF